MGDRNETSLLLATLQRRADAKHGLLLGRHARTNTMQLCPDTRSARGALSLATRACAEELQHPEQVPHG